jgi:hypothetical protein
VKAIQTSYKGVLFRSRLEARWAVFFDALAIRWQFEPEGYELKDGTKYLPDFWLRDLKAFLEVKPEADPFTKARKFARESKRSIILAAGEPGGLMFIASRASTRRGEQDTAVCINPGKDDHGRLWVDPSPGEVVDFQGEAAEVARTHRFWNPRRAA